MKNLMQIMKNRRNNYNKNQNNNKTKKFKL